MRSSLLLFLCLMIISAGCNPKTAASPAATLSSTPGLPSSTPRVVMLPTWTPRGTLPPTWTPTPRYSPTPSLIPITARPTIAPMSGSTELLLDRTTYSTLPKPTDLVTLQYDPATWSLSTAYIGTYMGYSLTHRINYGCALVPVVSQSTESYQVESFTRDFGNTKFDITRVSQAGVLVYTNYCTGEAETRTCYQMNPGADHAECEQAAETVLSSYKLIPNPFFGPISSSPNRWACIGEAGTVGLCQISYSIPLNALAFTSDGQGWAAGDDGVLFHKAGQEWSQVTSPATHPLYDISFSSPTDGWSVGDGAQVLHWDGNTWIEVLPYHGKGEGPGGSTQVLYAVDAFSTKEAWMVGAMTGIDGKISPYALHWNGTDLLEENSFPECNCGLNAVLVSHPGDVMAVGGSDLGAISFHWDGSAWTSMLVPGGDHLYNLASAPDGSIWSAGIEVARDLSDTRGTLFRWNGIDWQRLALPPLTGGVYALSIRPTGEIVLGGNFTALRTALEWQPITTDIAAYGWIVDQESDAVGNLWALTRSGNLFQLLIK